ncbi:hypothetical protein [Streptomyces dysideae]|uniref:Uncharacterized protein n=1 Tax=Streptomyces dysideae TaxID=909626 RepID=A0A117RYS1_9ACTN|nr:hypothetical protein [Streptomyces dysideae]KUO17162.1 hypothetical protein AQJ91_31845 [Streptomyces dysideae]
MPWSFRQAVEAADLSLGRSLVGPDVSALLDVDRVGGSAVAWAFEVVSAGREVIVIVWSGAFFPAVRTLG